jgi:GNAT superfamily N-acetyltransferase
MTTENQAMSVQIAKTEAEVRACFPVMRELRTHLSEADFIARVRRQEQAGYRLAYVAENGRVISVAGFRFFDNLASGAVLYVDDLATCADERSKGYGAHLFDWLLEQARARNCDTLELDSGVQRFAAHRFYLTRRMEIVSHHFRLNLRG